MVYGKTHTPLEGRLHGANYRTRISIPDYVTRLELHYDRCLDALDVKLSFRHFGLTVELETPVEFALHDEVRRFDSGLRALRQRYGSLTVTNAILPDRVRTREQRNIFKYLSYYTDWSKAQGARSLCSGVIPRTRYNANHAHSQL
jgi:hypothetical protein